MSWAEKFAERMAQAIADRDERAAQEFEFGDKVRLLPGGKVAWTVIHQGIIAVSLRSTRGAYRSELPSNLERWKEQ